MSQVAQQDHLYFEIRDINELTTEEKAGLLEKVKNGTILDTVLVVKAGSSPKAFAPILFASEVGLIAFYNNEDEAIKMIDLTEESEG